MRLCTKIAKAGFRFEIQTFSEFDPQQAKIVELKFFAGLTNEETAEVLDISDSTVKREWRIAKAWLATLLT